MHGKLLVLVACVSIPLFARAEAPPTPQPPPTDSIPAMWEWLARETKLAYGASPYLQFSRDYFTRFVLDPDAKPGAGEVQIDSGWTVAGADVGVMRTDFEEFLKRRMNVELRHGSGANVANAIVLTLDAGEKVESPEQFTLDVTPNRVNLTAASDAGLRAGLVKLVDLIGMRQAPILPIGKTTFRPRLAVRMGPVPLLGSYRELAFMGFNAASVGQPQLYDLTTNDAIPELAVRRKPGAMTTLAAEAKKAKAYGLRTYTWLATQKKFPKDDPVFKAHPEIRGALTWKADGEYVLCTEHPLVQKWLEESVQNVFRDAPDLDAAYVIIGGEGFYHCFMRPFGVAKGHTNCPRCEKLGPDVVVSNLVNRLAQAARKVRPNAEVIAWPYSAEHVWSSDRAQAGMIARLRPGAGLFTELEKDEFVVTPLGVRVDMWDYSLHMTGAGTRAKAQIEACKKAGVPIYLKSEPDCTFEAPRLSHLPAMDRWADRAETLASCGGSGAWVFSGFHTQFASWPCELQHHFWSEPHESAAKVLDEFAARIAGREAALHLRRAWAAVSESIEHSPEIPNYYTGPYYLGPAHPMCADASATVPQEFYGRYLFMAEMSDDEGLKLRPTFIASPTRLADVKEREYRKMETLLKRAADEIESARPKVPDRLRVMFDSEASPILWLYRTARTEANFFESCRLRDALGALWKTPKASDRAEARKLYDRWQQVLSDELENAQAAVPLMNADVRLDFRYFGDHSFEPGAKMLHAKVSLVTGELREYLPRRWAEYDKALGTARE